MADTLETLEVKIIHEASGAGAEVTSLARAVDTLGNTLRSSLPQLKEFAAALGRIKSNAKGIQINIGGGNNTHTINNAKGQSNWAKEQTAKIESEDVPGLKSIREALDMEELDFVSNTFNRIKDFLSGIASKAIEAKHSTDALSKSLSKVGSNRVSGSISGAAKSVKSFSDKAKESLPHVFNFLSALKRIAMYRFLRTIIKEITSALSEGLQNAYAFSSGIGTAGHRFAAALDGMKTSSTMMKNQLGSAFIALLATIAPIINKIISLITALANALSQLFAIFTGGTYLKAVEVPQQWAQAAGGAADAAEEWKNQLLGFDEINRLEAPGGGGGGGGGGMPNVSEMFEDTPIDGIFAKIKAKLDELKNSLNFEPLIASWQHLKQAVSEFADVVKSALAWAWENVLKPLAHWVIEEAAPRVVELLAKAFELLTAVLERLKPVFQWVWENILKPIAHWVGTAFTKFLDLVISLITKLTSLLKGETAFKDFLHSLSGGEAILLALAAAFIVVNGVLLLFKGVVLLATTVFGVFSAIIAAVTSPIGIAIIAITALTAAIIGIVTHWDEIVAAVQSAMSRVVSAVQSGVANIKAAFDKLRSMSLKDVFNSLNSAAENVFKKLLNTVKDIFNSIENLIKGAIERIRSLFKKDIQFPHIKLPHFYITGQFSLMPPSVPHIGVAYYAQGGFPEDGLFFANHNELVGKFANGMTAVANNEQIIEGIKQGVIEAMTLVLGSDGGGNKKTEFVFNLNGREFARAIYNDQQTVSREHGVKLITT